MAWLSNHDLNAILSGEERHQLTCENCMELVLQQELDWGGVHASNQLPPLPPAWSDDQKTKSYIFNTAPSPSPGEHWVAVRVYSDMIEYMDSYGLPAHTYPAIYQWLMKARGGHRQLSRLQLRIQGPNAYCGAYCTYFLIERLANASLYDTFFSPPGYVFTSTSPSLTDDSAIRTYLSQNDMHVFLHLLSRTQALLTHD